MDKLFEQAANGRYRPADKGEILQTAAELSLNLLPPAEKIGSGAAAANYIRTALAGQDNEVFVALWLDVTSRPISLDVISYGNQMETDTLPRRTIKMALDRAASAVVFAHNHPTTDRAPDGNHPSDADIKSLVSLKFLLSAIDVTLVDELVVNKNGYYSIVADPRTAPRVVKMIEEIKAAQTFSTTGALERLLKILTHKGE